MKYIADVIEYTFSMLIIAFLLFWFLIFPNITGAKKDLLICEKCNGRLSYMDTINYVDGITDYRYSCDTCGRIFRTDKWRGK